MFVIGRFAHLFAAIDAVVFAKDTVSAMINHPFLNITVPKN